MELKINIRMNNSAFIDGNGEEVSRILDKLSKQVHYESLVVGDYFKLYDINGNVVGIAEVWGEGN